MEILDNIVLPQSGGHISALHYLLILSMILLLVYTGALFGGTFFSLAFRILKRYRNNKNYLEISKNYIDLPASNKIFSLGFAVVPFISVMLTLSQLLHTGDTGYIAYMFASFILYMVGMILIFTYQNSFDVFALVNSFESLAVLPVNEKTENLINESKRKYVLNVKAGIWGFAFLFLSLWLFFASFSGAMNKAGWGNDGIFSILLNLTVLLKLAYFVAASLTLAAGYYLYIYFYVKKQKVENDTHKSALRFNLGISLVLTVAQGLLLSLVIFTFPRGALSSAVFYFLFASLIISLVAANLYYNIMRENKLNYIVPAFYLSAFIFVFFIVIDGSAFKVSNIEQEALLAANYQEAHAKMLEASGAGMAAVSGEDIFNNRCSACHSFDHRVIGPAYNDVLPKYEGKKNNLVAFILNPVKVNPDFPPMPNQGLKPNEAEAIADYLLKTYKK